MYIENSFESVLVRNLAVDSLTVEGQVVDNFIADSFGVGNVMPVDALAAKIEQIFWMYDVMKRLRLHNEFS